MSLIEGGGNRRGEVIEGVVHVIQFLIKRGC